MSDWQLVILGAVTGLGGSTAKDLLAEWLLEPLRYKREAKRRVRGYLEEQLAWADKLLGKYMGAEEFDDAYETYMAMSNRNTIISDSQLRQIATKHLVTLLPFATQEDRSSGELRTDMIELGKKLRNRMEQLRLPASP